jgi:hypothetical protein
MLDLAAMMDECAEALGTGDETVRGEFIEKWFPLAANEIQRLRDQLHEANMLLLSKEED